MSKRPSLTPMANKEKTKRKHSCLSIAQKVQLLGKLENGVSVKRLTEEYGIGKSTIYDLNKQKDKLLKFYADSDEQKLMNTRKTLHQAKNEDLDRVLKEWIRQCRRDHIPLTGLLVMKQAKLFHEKMQLEGNCEYTAGWLQKFKKRHGIRFLKYGGDKASADHEAAEDFIAKFAMLMANQNLAPEQVYNADETALFWRYCPRKILTTAEEKSPKGMKDAKDRITVLGCANAAGTHKCKLAVIGKSLRPRCLKGVNALPVHYYANRRAWVTRDIFSDWFQKHFVPEARAHSREAGLDSNCKILLLLDNCSAHPPAETLIKNNVYAMYLPPNVAPLIQPCDQGILRSLKSNYKNSFLNSMLTAVNRGMGVEAFQKQFNMKDAIYAVTSAWNTVTTDTILHAWHNLWPAPMFSEGGDLDDHGQSGDCEGFSLSGERQMMSDLLTYAKGVLSESVIKLEEKDIDEVFNIDNEATSVHSWTNGETAEMVLNQGENDDSDNKDDIVKIADKVPIDDLLKTCDRLIEGLEQHAFITEQEIMSVYQIKETLLRHRPLLIRQVTLGETLKKASSLEDPLPGPSTDL